MMPLTPLGEDPPLPPAVIEELHQRTEVANQGWDVAWDVLNDI